MAGARESLATWGSQEDLEDNTLVLTVMKRFNESLASEETSVLDASVLDATRRPLQMQYQQMMRVEAEAEQIHSGAQLLQAEREKMQMEMSHKRARIELEKQATTHARNYEREADRNQELQKQLRQCQEREKEAENKFKEQMEINKACQKSMESLNRKLQEKENQLAKANEKSTELKAKVSELQLKLWKQEMEIKDQELGKRELSEQLGAQRKQWQEASQEIQGLQAKLAQMTEKEQKIQALEQKLALQEEDAMVVRRMKADLVRFPKMKQDLQQLREENAYLREMKENNGLLREEVDSLQRKLERFEKVHADLVALELEKEKLQGKLNTWEKVDQSTDLSIKSPDDLSRYVVAMQHQEIVLKEQNAAIASSARELENARKQLQDELLKVQSQLLDEKKKREQAETMLRFLQKRVQLLIKTRDGLKGILNSYDSELLHLADQSPQLVARLEEAEDTVQKVEAHTAEMEVQLSQALEEAGNQKKRADVLEVELQLLKSQESTKELSFFIAREGVNALRLKIEELETERSQLEQEKRSLEMKLEQVGSHDSSKTKVLHLSDNPASLAKQQHQQEQANLREECQRLRERILVLERGSSLPETSEGSASLPEGTPSLPSTSEVSELKTKLESEKKINQRLKEIFHSKIQEFRKVYYNLTGYQIDMTCESQYRVTSMYAEHKEDCLIFRSVKPTSSKMQLLETEFSKTLGEMIDFHLHQQKCIPAFLSALTLDLFSRQTVA